MPLFTEALFKEKFNLDALDQTVASTVRFAAQDPVALYLFFQRYTHFNAYASAVIARLASSIGLSRYLFKNSELLIIEEADRGLEIAAQVMAAAADEGTDSKPVHRLLAQLLLKTVGDYAQLSIAERNDFAQIPNWLDEVVQKVIAQYQGTPGDIRSLIKALGFHTASEVLGDREYSLIDKIIRYENRGQGFDQHLIEKSRPVKIQGHKYSPWVWIVMHGKYDGSAAEEEHLACALTALNMVVRYSSVPEQQILDWTFEGFAEFVELQQRLFQEIHLECINRISHDKGSVEKLKAAWVI